jgi:2-(1,2-epoxy-1,2-dihydrophenyl)acetyl-CoA isomerase
MNDTVLLERDGGVATLTLNRAAALNTLDEAMIEALIAHTSALAADVSVRCVVIRGAGRHFMAGGDLNTFNSLLAMAPAERQLAFKALIARVHAVIESLYRMPAPIVASVRGAVAGFGLSLMCACDLALADDTAYFTSAYRNIGLTPDGGLTYALARIVGVRKAMEIVLLGERFDGNEALRLGLVNRLVAAAELDAATSALAQAIVEGPARALANGKRLVNRSLEASLSTQLRAEMESFAACAATADFAEGISAFLGKHAPRFRGE